MASLEYNVETVLLAVLAANNAFAATAIPARHKNDNTDAAKDRVIVSALPRQPEVFGKDAGEVKIWRVEVEIEVLYATKQTATAMDTVTEAIEAAITSPTTAGVIATATSLFPNGIEVKIPEELERETEPDKRRRMRRIYCLVRP